MKKKYLCPEVKEFAVTCMATGQTPSETSRMIEIKFGVQITPSGVQAYNPIASAGKDLSAPLRILFFEIRKIHEFIKDVEKCRERLKTT